MKAHTVRDWFDVAVLRQIRGLEVVDAGLATDRLRIAEMIRDRDLVYFQLEVIYQGERLHQVLCSELSLMDSEGFIIDSIPPRDTLDVTLEKGQCGIGGVMFSIYDDLKPVKLWLDTGHNHTDSKDSILLEIPLSGVEGRRPVTWQEEAALNLDTQLNAETAEGEGVLPLFETEALMSAVSKSLGMPHKKISTGYMFRVGLPDSRSQYVMMSFSGKDQDGADLIKFLTLCAPVGEGAHHEEFLKANPRLSYGGIGVARIETDDFYVVTNTQLVATADLEELVKSVVYLARKGDELENMLTGGGDLR